MGSGPAVLERRYEVTADSMNGGRPGRLKGRLSVVEKMVVRVTDFARTWRQVRGARCVIVPGTGVFEGELGTKPVGFPLAFWRTATACHLRNSAVLVAVGASPVRQRLSRWLFARGIDSASYATYRDDQSLETVRSWLGKPEHGKLAVDLAFGLPLPERKTVGRSRAS